jgi:hypothetical protein
LAIDSSTLWKYNQTSDLTTTDWTAPGYDDGAWPSGPGLLAVENCGCLPEPIRTTLSLGRSTYYFRTHFTFPGHPQGVNLHLRQVLDDGCIIYLNGVEVSRTRMPAGTPTYGTIADSNVADGVYEGPFSIPASSLLQGDNVLAVKCISPAPAVPISRLDFRLKRRSPQSRASLC